MSKVKSFSVGNGDMFYIRHNSDNFTTIDCCLTDDVKDDLESVKEQINAPAPKKKRLQKAVDGIQKFFGDFSPQLAAALAAHAITTTDWNAMIASVEKLISSL